MFKRIFVGLGLVLVLLIGAIFVLPSLVPTDSYREKLETELSRTLARDVSITGDIKISTFPVIAIETGGVTLANPMGYGSENFIDVDAMTAKVRLWPLLSKQVEISQISLVKPNIWLERKADGSTNWSAEDAAPKVKTDTYRRDGRYADYDPALDLLRIVDGQLRFIDAATDRDVSLKSVNLDLRAPALNEPLSFSGDLNFDEMPLTVDGNVKTPLNFLKGEITPIALSIETALGEIDVDGAFDASEAFDFTGKFNAKTSNPIGLSKKLPVPSDIAVPSLNAASITGQVSFKDGLFSFSNLDLDTNGPDLIIGYTGSFSIGDTPTAAGQFSAIISDPALINSFVDTPIAALAAFESLKTEGQINWDGSTFTASDTSAAANGSLVDMQFDGTATYSDSIQANGTFNLTSPDLPEFVKAAGLENADAAALKQVTAKGRVDLQGKRIVANDIIASASDGLINGDFNGQLAYDETLSLNGSATANIDDLTSLNAALAREIPFSDIAKRIGFSGDISTQNGTYILSETKASLEDGDVNGVFTGQLALGNQPDITGTLSLAVPSLRSLSQKRDIQLPENTDAGVIFEGLALSGQVSGTPDLMQFSNGKMSLDGLSGQGDFSLSLQNEQPKLTGDVALSALDLRPYMAAYSAQRPQGQILPWSTNIIDLSGLEAIDADLNITAPAIKLTRLDLDETNAKVTLQNGTLKTTIGKAGLYDGQATGVFMLSSSNGRPKIELTTDIISVKAQSFMMAMGGFDKVTGTSSFDINLSGSGQSQADIMKSLSGSGTFDAIKGQLLGLNAETLLTGIDSAVSTRQIPQGLGLGQTTDFNDLIGKFSISEGRLQLGNFQLQSGNFSMEGDGLIDLGAQNIDIGIRPKLNSGSDIANFGVPLRFSGGFGQARPSLDAEFLTKIATAKARKRAGEAVSDRLGGTLGDILGGVIGGQQTPEPTAPLPEGTPSQTPAENEQDVTPAVVPEPPSTDDVKEDATKAIEDEAIKRLNGLFGRKKKPDTPE